MKISSTLIKFAVFGAIFLWILFSGGHSGGLFTAITVTGGLYAIYATVSRNAAIKKAVASSLIEKMKEASFKPDYEYFHADGLQVSGVAIKKDDSRILLVTAGTDAKFFESKDVISVKSDLTTEMDIQAKRSMTGIIGQQEVRKNVFVVEVALRDLDTPRYKLYFPDKDQMVQWENRLTAWLDMQKTTAMATA
jgi:hypothetical protein